MGVVQSVVDSAAVDGLVAPRDVAYAASEARGAASTAFSSSALDLACAC